MAAVAVAALPSPDFASAFAEASADASAPSGALPDPIFAAIDAHARACAELEAHIDVLAAAEQAAWHAPRGAKRAANKRLKEEYAAQGRLCDLLGQQTERFVATVPHTLQGAAAALAYVRAHYAEGYPMCEEEETITLLGSIEQTIRAGLAVPTAKAMEPA